MRATASHTHLELASHTHMGTSALTLLAKIVASSTLVAGLWWLGRIEALHPVRVAATAIWLLAPVEVTPLVDARLSPLVGEDVRMSKP